MVEQNFESKGNVVMEERRRSKRLDLDVSVQLERLDTEGLTTLRFLHVKVFDISKFDNACLSIDNTVANKTKVSDFDGSKSVTVSPHAIACKTMTCVTTGFVWNDKTVVPWTKFRLFSSPSIFPIVQIGHWNMPLPL